MAFKSLKIAVLIEEIQLCDVATMDMFCLMSKKTLGELAAADPHFVPFLPQALDIQFFYVSSTLEPCNVSSGLRLVPTHTYDNCPRDLDIVLIGGPLPSHRPEASLRFMREAWPRTRVFITTCTGSVWLSASGVLDGHKATTNRKFLGVARHLAPAVDWQEQRWVVQPKEYKGEGKGEVWTAGGAGAGIDMMATFCLQNFDKEFVENVALEPLDMTLREGHGQFYTI